MVEFRRDSDKAMHGQNAELLKEVGEIKGSLKSFIENQEKHNERSEKQWDKVDERLREVENKTYLASGVVSAVISVAVGLGTMFLGNKH